METEPLQLLFEERLPEGEAPGKALKNLVLSRVRQDADFPAMSPTVNLVSLLSQSSEASIDELANIILQDYGLTSKILKIVNSVYYMGFGEVTTISRAIILLGIQNLKAMVLGTTFVDNVGRNAGLGRLKDLMPRVIFSGALGRQIAKTIDYSNEEEVFVCSLFNSLGEILVAYYAPEKHAKIRSLLSGNMAEEERTEFKKALSKTYEDIGLFMAQEWGIPHRIVQSMKGVNKYEMKAPGEVDRLRSVCTIANRIVEVVGKGLNKEEERGEIQAVLKPFGEEFRKIEEQMDRITSQSGKDVSKYCEVYNVDLKASSLATRLSGAMVCDGEKEEPGAAGTKAAPDYPIDSRETGPAVLDEEAGKADGLAAREDQDIIFAQGMQDVTQTILEQYEVNDVLIMILETIYRGLKGSGLTRTVLFVRDPSFPVMNARLAFGDSLKELKTWFTIPVVKRNDLFNLALRQEKLLLIKDTEKYGENGFFPSWYAERIKEPLFLILIPVMVNGRAICLIHIEGKRDAFSVSEAHFNYLRILQNQAVVAIRQKAK